MSDNITILAVEDNEADRKLLSHALKQNGFKGQFLTAGSADEAYRLMVKRIDESLPLPNLVLLDLGLPDGNGHELMTRFKEVRKEQHIVLVTADDSIESIQRAISAGANGYVVKPYSQEKIHDVVSNYAMVHGGDMAQMQGLDRHH